MVSVPGDGVMGPALVSRSVLVEGRRIPLQLEPAIWEALDEICMTRGKSLDTVCTEIGRSNKGTPLPSPVRIAVLDYYRQVSRDQRRLATVRPPQPPVAPPGREALSREDWILSDDFAEEVTQHFTRAKRNAIRKSGTASSPSIDNAPEQGVHHPTRQSEAVK
jgi:predicted DNA-binding ribbon-helix-helix protein